MTRFTLATVRLDGRPVAAIGLGENYYPLPDIPPDHQRVSVKSLLENWTASLPHLETLASDIEKGAVNGLKSLPSEEVHLLTPILWPNKVVCVGANYAEHLKEMGMEPVKWEVMPFFLCPPTTSLVGPGETIEIPRMTEQFDWELEMAVIVGEKLRHASEEEASNAIAAYSIGLDLSCRDLTIVNNQLRVDLSRGKSQDTMKPLGPYIVPAKFLPNVSNLKLRLDVNGQRMMNSSTSDMLSSCKEILSVISQFITLEPGDVVFTGSPPGSAGVHGNCWLKPGDMIRAEIEGIGTFDVQVKKE
jgi:2,4-didehydro-3-deoxy-L-rhamnonate hydrolase